MRFIYVAKVSTRFEYFLARLALTSVLSLREVVLDLDLNFASIGVKIIGGHCTRNILPK